MIFLLFLSLSFFFLFSKWVRHLSVDYVYSFFSFFFPSCSGVLRTLPPDNGRVGGGNECMKSIVNETISFTKLQNLRLKSS